MGSNLGTVATVDTGRPEPYLTKHLKRWSLEDLFAAGDAVEELVEHPGWDSLMRLVDAEYLEVNRRLGALQEPLTQAEYALAHGRLAGLRAARDAAEAILHRYRDKLEEQRRKHEGDDGSSQGV